MRAAYRSAPSFIASAIAFKGEDCLLWPYAKTRGYGVTRIARRAYRVHRIVCEAAHGPPNGLETAHTCGNASCVNPGHLRWATRTDNLFDRHSHGTVNYGRRNGQSKLTDDQVREIFRAPGTKAQIARDFGVTRGNVWAIKTGKTWGRITHS